MLGVTNDSWKQWGYAVTENSPPNPGLPLKYLRHALLMLLEGEPCHGYDLLEQVHELGLVAADMPGLYRSLRSMEEDGLVASEWEKSQFGPPRRSYRLSDAGKIALSQALGELSAVHDLLTKLLERFGGLIDDCDEL